MIDSGTQIVAIVKACEHLRVLILAGELAAETHVQLIRHYRKLEHLEMIPPEASNA